MEINPQNIKKKTQNLLWTVLKSENDFPNVLYRGLIVKIFPEWD